MVKRLHACTSGTSVQSLVRELRSCISCGKGQDKQTSKNSKTKGKKKKEMMKNKLKKLNYEQCDEICFMVQRNIYLQ